MSTCTYDDCRELAMLGNMCRRHYNREYQRQRRVSVRSQVRDCAHCGISFSGRDRRATYCSFECKEKARALRRVIPSRAKLPQFVNCVHCGKQLRPGMQSSAKLCSAACRTASHRQRMKNQPETVMTLDMNVLSACLYCGGPLPGKRRKYCSDQCRSNYANRAVSELRKSTPQNPCGVCGTLVQSRLAKYCSDPCRKIANLASTYGVTLSEMAALFEQSDGCASCGTTDWGVKGPHVDHDHLTGRVRDILCYGCNQAIGLMKEDPYRLRLAADYLDRHAKEV